VWQWCEDRYGEYPKAAVTDPSGPKKGSNLVIRGGCWLRGPQFCRSANRHKVGPAHSRNYLGFRLAVPAQ
jgi:formylglycine-generating enzyme required for sulfatase activity